MSTLPQIDPAKLYQKAMAQVNSLSDQAMQMDALIEALVEERDKAIEERDKAQEQLAELRAKLTVHSDQKAAKDKKAEE